MCPPEKRPAVFPRIAALLLLFCLIPLLLAACGRDQRWLQKVLQREGLASPRQVFLLTLDEQGQIVCIKKEEEP